MPAAPPYAAAADNVAAKVPADKAAADKAAADKVAADKANADKAVADLRIELGWGWGGGLSVNRDENRSCGLILKQKVIYVSLNLYHFFPSE